MPTIFEELGIDITKAKKNTSIKHYGVKGQKWGVRKDRKGRIKARATMDRRTRRALEAVEGGSTQVMNPDGTRSKSTVTTSSKFNDKYNAIYRKAAPKIRKETRRLNASPEFKDQDFSKDSPTRRKYYDAFSKMATDQLNAAAVGRFKTGGGKFALNFDLDANSDFRPNVTIRRIESREALKKERSAAKETRSLKHADTDVVVDEAIFELVYDDKGYIIDYVVPEDSTIKQFDTAEDFLMHYGIKGMRWGVRRSERQLARARTKLEDDGDPTTGTQNAKVSTTRTRYKSGPKRLTESELKERISRMENEKRYNDLNARTISEGEAFIRSVLKDSTKAVATKTATALLMRTVQKTLAVKMGDEAVKEMFKKK